MITLTTLLVIVALVFLVLAAFNVPSGRISFGWMGVAILAIVQYALPLIR